MLNIDNHPSKDISTSFCMWRYKRIKLNSFRVGLVEHIPWLDNFYFVTEGVFITQKPKNVTVC